jgi:hypothetical protein
MRNSSIFASAVVASALVASLGTTAASPDDDHRRGPGRLKAELRGFSEVPAVSTPARGSFRAVLSKDKTEIEYRLDYSDLEGTVLQSHIHVGARHTTGGISVWLCGTADRPGPVGTPTCGAPGGQGPEAWGTLTADNVIGPSGQLIAPGEFAELIRAIKAGITYVNVHTSAVPSGEIRGQIKVD